MSRVHKLGSRHSCSWDHNSCWCGIIQVAKRVLLVHILLPPKASRRFATSVEGFLSRTRKLTASGIERFGLRFGLIRL